MNYDGVTRIELIDHSTCSECGADNGVAQSMCTTCHGSGMIGRQVIMRDDSKHIAHVVLQDDNRTLKIFIDDRQNTNNT